MITRWTRRKPTTGTRCSTLFNKWQGSFVCPVTPTRRDTPRPLFTQSWTTDTAGYTKAFIYPVMDHRHSGIYQGLYLPSHGPPTRRDIPRPLFTQSWTTDKAGYTKAFIYPVMDHRQGGIYQGLYLPSHGPQTQLDIPRPLFTQSWTTDTAGYTKAFIYPVMDHRHSWIYFPLGAKINMWKWWNNKCGLP